MLVSLFSRQSCNPRQVNDPGARLEPPTLGGLDTGQVEEEQGLPRAGAGRRAGRPSEGSGGPVPAGALGAHGAVAPHHQLCCCGGTASVQENAPTKAASSKETMLNTTINIFSKSFQMLASLKTQSFVLSTWLKLHPKTTAGGRCSQKREQDAETGKLLLVPEGPCSRTALCPVRPVVASTD